jgi:hypothetical protein
MSKLRGCLAVPEDAGEILDCRPEGYIPYSTSIGDAWILYFLVLDPMEEGVSGQTIISLLGIQASKAFKAFKAFKPLLEICRPGSWMPRSEDEHQLSPEESPKSAEWKQARKEREKRRYIKPNRRKSVQRVVMEICFDIREVNHDYINIYIWLRHSIQHSCTPLSLACTKHRPGPA